MNTLYIFEMEYSIVLNIFELELIKTLNQYGKYDVI